MTIGKVTVNAMVQLLFESTLMSQNSMSIAHIHQTVAPVKWRKWTRSIVFKPTVSTSPVRNTVLRCTPHPRSRNSGSGAQYLCFIKPSRWFCCELKFKNYGYRWPSVVFSSSRMPSWYNYFALYSSKCVFNLTNKTVPGTKTALYKCFTNISSFNPHTCSLSGTLFSSPLYRWGNVCRRK